MPPEARLFKFATTAGAELCRKIAQEKLKLDPHDYVLEGVGHALDGLDLLAVTPTGSGKTSYLIVYLIVMCALVENPALCPGARKFPQNPAMIVVCPTKSLELDMEPKFTKSGLSTLVINADTLDVARRSQPRVNLWAQAAEPSVRAIILAPEQLSSKGYTKLLANQLFQARIVALAVDEAHLMDAWGNPSFRPAFKQIGYARARLPSRTVVFALTATLRAGKPTHAVRRFLGFADGHYHLIRRSNTRFDIQLIFRTMSSGSRSMVFPELDWVLTEERRIIIFCRTIAVGFRVAVYLWHRAVKLPDRDQRLRLYNSLNASSYNCATLKLLHEDSRARVTIATDTLAVGIDAANTDDVVLYDHELPSTTDMILQKIGRIRDGSDRGSRGIVYLPRNADEQARKLIDAKSGSPPSKRVRQAKRTQRADSETDISTARLILASCKIAELNTLYDNPEADQECHCEGCLRSPPPRKPDSCNCSGCTPEPTPSLDTLVAAPVNTSAAGRATLRPPAPRREHITKKMRTYAKKKLTALRLRIWWQEDPLKSEMYPSEEFLPELLMDVLLDDLHLITDVDSVRVTLMDYVRLRDHLGLVLEAVEELRGDFERTRAEARAAAREKRRATIAAKKAREITMRQQVEDGEEEESLDTRGGRPAGQSDDGEDDSESIYWSSESENESGSEINPADDERGAHVSESLKIRIPGREGPKEQERGTELQARTEAMGLGGTGRIRIPGGRMQGPGATKTSS